MTGDERLMAVSEQRYGPQYKADLMTLFRDYVASADRVSERRHTANQFFSSINTVLLMATGFIPGEVDAVHWQVALAGVLLCIIWRRMIAAYRNLNAAKFRVIHDIERQLPLAVYSAEWDYFEAAQGGRKFMTLSTVEAAVPVLFMGAYVFVYLLGIWRGAGS